MIRHIVVFFWLPEATDDAKRQASAEIAKLPGQMTGLLSYQFGVDAGLNQGNADFAIVADFEDTDAYLAYRDHPAHLDVITRFMRPITKQRVAVQLAI
jgi:hypothetical protein